MERIWTESQISAINSDNRNLLVSAAAGSGKTSVLTERILQKILGGADISRMLVVTFTKAAASELKSRISAALSDALTRDPTNRMLAKQISALPSAKISTVDSFCYDIVKRNFDKLGLPCNIRIADETEIKLLFKKTMDTLFEEMYDSEGLLENFTEFTDSFISDRDDNLPDVFISLYNSLSSTKDGIEFIKKSKDILESETELPFFKMRTGKYAAEYIKKFISHFLKPAKDGAALYLGGNKSEAKYSKEFSNIVTVLEKMSEAIEKNDYEACFNAARSYSPISMNGTKLGYDDAALFYKSLRTDFKDDIVKISEKLFAFDKDEIKRSIKKTSKALDTLYTLLDTFEKKVSAEKKRRGIIDFSDVERFALKLLCDKGEPSGLAREYSSNLDEVYIDEYQDINEVQDTIFRMVSISCKRFMVGDIKQSIYGFRGSDPSIFSSYRNEFSDDDNAENKRIFLSENFRCDESIVDFTNIVFSHIMNLSLSGIKYEKADRLVYSLNKDKPALPVELILLKKPKKDETVITESQYVAKRIKELINSGYSPNDIAVLFRSPKNSVEKFENELSLLDVPYYSSISRSFFENPEVLLAMCLLNTIDNPRRDVYLAGALRSPVFGFTLDDLVKIRNTHKNGCLFDALCNFSEENKSEKVDYFISWLEHMRDFARSKPIDKLIWHLYSTTSLLSISYASSGGKIKRANLMMLYEYARKFEASSFKGLYNFILYINEIIKSEETIDEAKNDSDAVPTVKLMSIHASKGLEFKVVFICRTEAPFNKRDINSNIVLNPALGCAMQLGDETGFGKYNTLMRSVIQLKNTEEAIDEEMRILYVALTRAKERLFITATQSDKDKFTLKCETASKTATPYSLSKLNTYADMIMTALKASGNVDECWRLINIEGEEETGTADPQIRSDNAIESVNIPDYDTCRRIINGRLAFEYPYSALVELPSKISVSKLYPDILDDNEKNLVPPKMTEVPDFIVTEKPIDPAEKGTATHLFLQFCDFDSVEKNGVKEEAERLSLCKFISERTVSAIDFENLQAFFASPLYLQIKNAEKCYREFRFNVNFPAADFTSDRKSDYKNDNILVQGVIDCFIVTENGIKIIDYKTDSFSPAQKKNRQKCRQILTERHSTQLKYYKRALETLFNAPVFEISVFSLSLGEEITIP